MASLRRLPEFEVVGVVEPDERRRSVARNKPAYAGLRWMTEEALFDADGLQAVAVETEVDRLIPSAQRAINAGLHIHLDKPAGESLPPFAKLLAEAARRRLTVQMGYMFRYNPAFQQCFRFARDGWLGRIFSAHAVMGKVLGGMARQELRDYPGGAMFELGCHVIDAVVYVLGRPERVVAHGRSSSALKDGFPDNQLAVLEYPHATATVRANLIEVEGFARRQFVVCGDEGTFDIRPLEPPRARLALAHPHGPFEKGYQDLSFPETPRYDEDFRDLARVVRGEKEFAFAAAHDLAVQETILRASGLPVG